MYSLIIVDYNSIEATMDYIDRCRQYLGAVGAVHIVIVENGKEEGVAEALADRFGDSITQSLPDLDRNVYCYKKDEQEIIYCASGDNLGYARGNNLGAEIANAIWHDPFYIISNNDLVFSEVLDLSKIDTLFSENPQIGVIGPLVVTSAGECQSPRRWLSAPRRLLASYGISAFGSLLGKKWRLRLWNKHCNDTVVDAPSGYCDWVSGCFMFVRADAFHKAGMFDPHTFLYAEEPILAKRLEAIGSRVYFCREVAVIHKHAESTKKAIAKFRMVEIEFDANCYFYSSYMGTSKACILCAKTCFKLYRLMFQAKHKFNR